MMNPMKFHSQVESSSTMEHGPTTRPTIPSPTNNNNNNNSSNTPTITTTNTTHLQGNFTTSKTTTTTTTTSKNERLSPPTISSPSSVVGTNLGTVVTSPSNDNNNNNNFLTTTTTTQQTITSLGFNIGGRRGSTSQASGRRNSLKSPSSGNQIIFQHANDFNQSSSSSSWISTHKGPILVVRVSRIEHLNVYPSSEKSGGGGNSSSTTSNTSTPVGTPLNTTDTTSTTTSTSSSTASYTSSSEIYGNYNPHLVVGYGRLKSSAIVNNNSNSSGSSGGDTTEQSSSVFEQKTKTLQSEVHPIYNTVFHFPLLTMDFSKGGQGRKISELIKLYPEQLFSPEALQQHGGNNNNNNHTPIVDDTTVLSFKVLSHNRNKKKHESVIAVAELNLGDLPHVTNDEKLFLRMRKPGEPLKKTDMIYGGEVLPENQPILHLDVKVVWNDKFYKTVGDDESSTSFEKWNDVLTQLYIQEEGMGDEEFDNDPLFAQKPEDKIKSLERILNQCELTKFLTFPVPYTWHLIGKPDKLILVSPTQLTNEEIFTDNINVYYVYESNTRNVLEEMLKNSEKRSFFNLTIPLHNFKMLSNWKGFRFSCYYSLYNKIYHQNVIGIQTKIGISYILQYVSNCGSPNQPVFDKLLERLTLLPSIYSKELERGKIWCGAVPCAWRGVNKDSIIHLYSPYQCNAKLNCTDQILFQPFTNNMTTMERIRFILNKYMDDPDFEGLEILEGPLSTDLNDHFNNVMFEECNVAYKDLEQLDGAESVDTSQEPDYWKKKRRDLPESLNISKDAVEEASTITFAVRMKTKPPKNTYDVPPPTSFSNSYILYQKTAVLKMKNVDYQLHISYKTTLNSHLVSEGVFNRLVQSLKLT